MFSYRHAYHAGNHADLLKHLTLCSVLSALQRKEAGLTLIDTHAGCGLYALHSAQSQHSGEARTGIHPFMAACASTPAPIAVQRYAAAINAFEAAAGRGGHLRHYPGSPALLWQALRTQDTLHCFELLGADARQLQRQLLRCHQTAVAQLPLGDAAPLARKKWRVHNSDGFAGLRALLPPPSRRALVLIDPSYEIKTDYAIVTATVKDAMQRFATGCYVVWIPEIPRTEAHTLPRKLRALAQQHGKSYLCATLRLPHQLDIPADKLQGSRICFINPPFALAQELKDALPFLAQALGHSHPVQPGRAWELDLALV